MHFVAKEKMNETSNAIKYLREKIWRLDYGWVNGVESMLQKSTKYANYQWHWFIN